MTFGGGAYFTSGTIWDVQRNPGPPQVLLLRPLFLGPLGGPLNKSLIDMHLNGISYPVSASLLLSWKKVCQGVRISLL